MNTDALFLFLILLLGLVLCSFLGGKGCIEGMENGSVYYGPNGAAAVVQTDSNGNNTLVVTTSNGISTTYTSSNTSSDTSSDTYTALNGSTATLKSGSNRNAVQIKDSNGNVVLTLTKNTNTENVTATTQNGTTVSSTNNYDNYNHYNGTSYPTIFYGPDGGTARVIQTPNNNTIVITNKNGTTEIYYIDKNIDFVDMCMMSLCDHNIIANSTFSWWGAWLNPNPYKKVIAPSNWLGPEIKHLQTNDLYCKNWIII